MDSIRPFSETVAGPVFVSRPIVFNHDSTSFMVLAQAHVFVYAVSDNKLWNILRLEDAVATLRIPPSITPKNESLLVGKEQSVVNVVLHPEHSQQIIVAYSHGLLVTWDYEKGTPMSHVILPFDIHCLCISPFMPSDYFIISSKHQSVSSRRTGKMTPSNKNMNDNKCLERVHRIYQWNAITRKNKKIFESLEPLLISLHVSLAQSSIYFCTGKTLFSYNFITQKKSEYIHERAIECMDVCLSRELIALGDVLGKTCVIFLEPAEKHDVTPQPEPEKRKRDSVSGFKSLPILKTTTLHWHAHPVSSVRFTSDGSHLLSGGQEGVLVSWRIRDRHTSFLPRLGGTLFHISAPTTFQESELVALSLSDNSVRFTYTGNLKIMSSLVGLKCVFPFDSRRAKILLNGSKALPFSNSSFPENASTTAYSTLPRMNSELLTGLVTSHSEETVVVNGLPGHIQIYSLTHAHIISETVVCEQNIIARTNQKPLLFTHVHFVDFIKSDPNAEMVMGTIDIRADSKLFECSLKFWERKLSAQSTEPLFKLMKQFDMAHEASVTAFAFAKKEQSADIVTAASSSLDKTFKIWQGTRGRKWTWSLAFTGSYKEKVPTGLTFTQNSYHLLVPFVSFPGDGGYLATPNARGLVSLGDSMELSFCLDQVVTLWNSTSGQLVHVFSVMKNPNPVPFISFSIQSYSWLSNALANKKNLASPLCSSICVSSSEDKADFLVVMDEDHLMSWCVSSMKKHFFIPISEILFQKDKVPPSGFECRLESFCLTSHPVLTDTFAVAVNYFLIPVKDPDSDNHHCIAKSCISVWQLAQKTPMYLLTKDQIWISSMNFEACSKLVLLLFDSHQQLLCISMDEPNVMPPSLSQHMTREKSKALDPLVHSLHKAKVNTIASPFLANVVLRQDRKASFMMRELSLLQSHVLPSVSTLFDLFVTEKRTLFLVETGKS